MYLESDFLFDNQSESVVPMSSVVNNEYVRDFLLGGNCHCSVENIKSGNCFIYKIQRNKNKNNMYFVNVESGLGYIYCGYFYLNADTVDYHKGEKGNLDKNDIRIQALIYTIEHARSLPSFVLVQQLGKCCSCGNDLVEIEEMRRGKCNLCYDKIKI